jgi:hypothetical protein
MPTYPIFDSGYRQARQEDSLSTQEPRRDAGVGGPSSPFTPLTIALQGTLQLSHLHIWTEMNVLLHQSSISMSPTRKQDGSGRVIAGTAYSVPSALTLSDSGKDDTVNVPLDMWAPGQGTKVVRGEPLSFTFRVGWLRGTDVLGLAASSNALHPSERGFFSQLLLFVMVAGVGAAVALWWEKCTRSRRGGWKGEGLLGRPASGRSLYGGGSSGVGIGSGARTNGYGGYGMGDGSGGSNGYGGYSSGKRD